MRASDLRVRTSARPTFWDLCRKKPLVCIGGSLHLKITKGIQMNNQHLIFIYGLV